MPVVYGPPYPPISSAVMASCSRAGGQYGITRGGRSVLDGCPEIVIVAVLGRSAGQNVISDGQTALPIENDVGTDPAMLPDFHITEDQDVVVAGGTFAKSVVTGNFPPVGQ